MLFAEGIASTYVYRASSGNGNSSATSVTVTKPSGTLDGDLLVVGIYTESPNGITPPAGWTLATSHAHTSGNFSLFVFWKIAATEGASWVFSHTTGTNAWITSTCGAYSGALGTNDTRVDVFGSSEGTSALLTAQTAPSVTPTASGALLVQLTTSIEGGTTTEASGAARNWRRDDGGVALTDRTLPSVAPTGVSGVGSTGGGTRGTATYIGIHVAFVLDTGTPSVPSVAPLFYRRR